MPRERQKPKFSLATDVPYIHNTEELGMWLKPKYIIKDMLTDADTYRDNLARITNIVRGCYPIYECRTYPVKFKFNKSERRYHTLELRHFLINFILWRPFVELNDLDVINESHIMSDFEHDIPNLDNFINRTLIHTLRNYHIKSTTINYDIAEVLHNLVQIDIDYGLILGLNFTMKTFVDMYTSNDEVREIMETRFAENEQPYEIEQKLDTLQAREIAIFKEDPENPIGVILRAGTGIKEKQLTEFTISQGLYPTLEGKTIPRPIQNSTLVGGLASPSDLFTSAMGSRKSLVLNAKVMGKAGYFAKIVVMLARTLSMSLEVSDCGTKHLVAYNIKSKKHLMRMQGKFFKESLTDLDYQVMDDPILREDLIGKTIYTRSAVTCALNDDHVCIRCIGVQANASLDIADGLTAFESEEITKEVEQRILSTKHLLTTLSEVIEFNSSFYKFFEIICGEITPRVNNNEDVPNITDYAIWIDPNDLKKVEELDDESLFNSCLYNGRFYIVDMKHPDETPIVIQSGKEKELYISNVFMDIRKANKGYVPFSQLDENDKVFEIVIMNHELTRSLYDLMDLLNKDNSDNEATTINNVSQKFLDLLIESGIDVNVSAAEIITNRLVRSVARPYDRPDFTKDELEPYQIWPVYRCLEKNKSATVGLSFQNIKRQFLSDALFEERNGTSFLDAFYKPQISTHKLIEYRKFAREAKKDNLM